MMRLTMIKRTIDKDMIGQHCFIPFTNADAERFSKAKRNVAVTVNARFSRNPLHHNKYFGLCGLLVNAGYFMDETAASDFLKCKVGLVDVIEVMPDRTILKPRSINWESMPQDEFQIYFERIVGIVAEKLGCSLEDIKSNLIFDM